MTITIYRVVAEHKAALLAAEVGCLIAKGWQPIGGVSCFVGEDPEHADDRCVWYVQAMGLPDATHKWKWAVDETGQYARVDGAAPTFHQNDATAAWAMTEEGKKYLAGMGYEIPTGPEAGPRKGL